MRSDHLISASHAVLVLVDVQERLLPAIAEHEAMLRRIDVLLQGAAALSIPLLVTEQYPRGLGPTVASLRERIRGIPVHEKMAFSCAGCASFLEALRAFDRRQVVLCGIETHVCVLQTAFDLAADGFEIHIPADAVGSRLAANRDIALQRMRHAGMTITTSESVLFEALEVAGTDTFKQVAKLVR